MISCGGKRNAQVRFASAGDPDPVVQEDRAQDDPRLGQCADGLDAGPVPAGGHPASQAEVEDFDEAVLRDEEVLGLQVPMHDSAGMRGGEAAGDLPRVVGGFSRR